MLNSSQALILHRFESNANYDAVLDADFTFRNVRDTLEENILRTLREFAANER